MKLQIYFTENLSTYVKTYECSYEKFLEIEKIEFDPKVDVTIVYRDTSYDLDGFLAARACREFAGRYEVVVFEISDGFSMPRKYVLLKFLNEA